MPILIRPGAEISYEILGESGGWVTLVNGHTRTAKDFKVMARRLNEAGFRCLVFDHRGAGQTHTSRAFTFDEMIADVEALWNEIGSLKTHLLGISMGGLMCQALAAQKPQCIERLVLVSTMSRQQWLHTEDDNPWGNDLQTVGRRMREYFAADFAEKNKILIDAMSKQIFQQITSGHFKEQARAQRLAMKGFETADLLSQIKASTLIMHGEADRIIPYQAAEEIHDGIANSQLEIIPGVGHLLLAEYAKPFYERVTRFFTHEHDK